MLINEDDQNTTEQRHAKMKWFHRLYFFSEPKLLHHQSFPIFEPKKSCLNLSHLNFILISERFLNAECGASG